jgi:hypothetical protein
MQLLERGVDPALLKGQFDAVSRLEGGNTVGIIERFRTMYGLNYQGAAQVWDMMKTAKRDPETGEYLDAEKLAKDIKEIQDKPDFQSDSKTLQNILNDLNQKGIQIGNIEFLRTELPILNKAMVDLNEVLRIHTAVPSMEVAGNRLETILASEETIDDVNKYINPHGGGAGAHFMLGMGDLVAAENKKTGIWPFRRDDANAQKIGKMFNSEIAPYLPENPGENILRLLSALNDQYYAASHGGESGWEVGPNELTELTTTINQLKSAIHTLEGTVENLEREGIEVHGTIDAYPEE